jgi:hypothetical protein
MSYNNCNRGRDFCDDRRDCHDRETVRVEIHEGVRDCEKEEKCEKKEEKCDVWTHEQKKSLHATVAESRLQNIKEVCLIDDKITCEAETMRCFRDEICKKMRCIEDKIECLAKIDCRQAEFDRWVRCEFIARDELIVRASEKLCRLERWIENAHDIRDKDLCRLNARVEQLARFEQVQLTVDADILVLANRLANCERFMEAPLAPRRCDGPLLGGPVGNPILNNGGCGIMPLERGRYVEPFVRDNYGAPGPFVREHHENRHHNVDRGCSTGGCR